MKKVLLPMVLCSAFLFSCEKENLKQDYNEKSELAVELDQLVASYEESLDDTNDFTLKGYMQSGIKDEVTPTNVPETKASDEIINYLKAKIDQDKASEYSKMARIEYPKPWTFKVGVFKTTTCGNSPEFIYSMDCEDGGWTELVNPKNLPFATSVDRNGNVVFHMCVVNSENYGGWTLSLGPIISTNHTLSTVQRFHDNEDHGNQNNIVSDVLPDANGYMGSSQFTGNTLFSWINDRTNLDTSRPNLNFSYGVISGDGNIDINIDDENGSNANWARYYVDVSGGQWKDLPYEQWYDGFYCWANTTYRVKIKN